MLRYTTRIRARYSSYLKLVLLSYDRGALSLQVLRKAYFQVVSIYESAPPSVIHIVGIIQGALKSGLNSDQPDLGKALKITRMIIELQLLLSFGVKLVLCGGLRGFEDCTSGQKASITVPVTSCSHVLNFNLLTSISKLTTMLSHLPKSVSPLTRNHKLPSIISARSRTTRISVLESRRPSTQLRIGRKEATISSSVAVAIYADSRGVEVYKG